VPLWGVYELAWEGNAYAAGGALTSHFGLSINGDDPIASGESIVYHPSAGGEAEMGRTRRYFLKRGRAHPSAQGEREHGPLALSPPAAHARDGRLKCAQAIGPPSAASRDEMTTFPASRQP
jgi:hypothetical protein